MYLNKKEFVRYYKPAKFSYENCKEIISHKGLSVNKVVDIVVDKLVLKNHESGEEMSLPYDISDAINYKIEDESIVITKGQEIINVIQNKHFLA